jgi:cytochrome o ubiquinol oxidase subunit 2
MKKKQTNGLGLAKILVLIVSGLSLLGLTLAVMLRGKNVAVLHTKGAIADEQRSLIIFATVVILAIAVPTLILLYFMAWKYRESNTKAKYHPEAERGKLFNFIIWALPASFMFILALGLVPATHKLQPNKAISSNAKPITIQVTAMQWKWLFVYPDQQIATVNYVQIPEDVPVVFDLIADEAPMSSFWIPNLGGQLYAMTGHVNQLNLIANEKGEYQGKSAEINGAGYAGMTFTTKVSSAADFEAWVQATKRTPSELDKATYKELLKPSEDNQVSFYSPVDNTLYSTAIMKYAGSSKHGKSEHGGGH